MRQLALTLAMLSLCASSAWAALTLVPNAGTSHIGNLVNNGSFENTAGGGPTPGGANNRLWATGTAQNFLPFAVPSGWTSAGNANTYATWGQDGPQLTLRQSDTFPHGQYGMYFGNGGVALVNEPPTFNPNGTVTFPASPTVTLPLGYPSTVTLTQTVPTSSNPAAQYGLSFWISGEGAFFASDPTGSTLGIFGFKMTNVLPGDPVNYLAVPSASDNFLGKSKRFDFLFTPINASQDVTIEFINYGHFDLSMYGRSTSTELVLDDVMVNGFVPEPAGLSALGLAAAALRRRRR